MFDFWDEPERLARRTCLFFAVCCAALLLMVWMVYASVCLVYIPISNLLSDSGEIASPVFCEKRVRTPFLSLPDAQDGGKSISCG